MSKTDYQARGVLYLPSASRFSKLLNLPEGADIGKANVDRVDKERIKANSASDARGSEQDIRSKLIEAGVVDVMVAGGSNFFYTVTLPCTFWFLDRGKAHSTNI